METIRRWQTIEPLAQGVFRLPVSSPYFQPATVRKADTVRDIRIILGLMNLKAEIADYTIAGDIILEVAPTNSATAGDWVEWGRIGNSQTISLALTLNSVQVTKGMAVCFVPAGYYVKARTAGSGTVSYTLTNAKQIFV